MRRSRGLSVRRGQTHIFGHAGNVCIADVCLVQIFDKVTQQNGCA